MPASIVWASSSVPVRVQVVDERGVPVRNAVVEINADAQGSGRITFPWRMAMAQRGEQFVPGTLVVAKGSTVAFPNLDRVRHSIYSFSKPARFEIDLYGRDQTRSHSFPVSGSVKLGCKIHDEMRGYIRVVDTPHAGKSDANGYVQLTGVPTGGARITVWHPQLRAPGGEIGRSVTISGGSNRHVMKVTLR
ncbi:hypothetical protein SAMN04488060_2892 [Qipengyuania nanhaisediminis]|uniref:Plastocyanin n=1 Tax=Qipengyuania nanhaisediminis TaxID=604088 RepID=A0A1I5QED1_9SPHN|nr:hypothetical protein SAMN04488060_2892 [Qipengyuania nanhaisediminis]